MNDAMSGIPQSMPSDLPRTWADYCSRNRPDLDVSKMFFNFKRKNNFDMTILRTESEWFKHWSRFVDWTMATPWNIPRDPFGRPCRSDPFAYNKVIREKRNNRRSNRGSRS